MRILFFNVSNVEKEIIKTWSDKNSITVKTLSDSINYENIYLTKSFDAVIFYPGKPFKTDEKLYAKLAENGIRQISIKSTGYDNINFTFAKKYHLIITNVPDYSPESVSHFTVMSVIMLLRNLPRYLDNPETTQRKSFMGRELTEVTVGIYGTGRLGSLVAKTLKFMGARVIMNSHSLNSDLIEFGIEFVDFTKLLFESDVLSIHVPLNKQTYHKFDFDALSLMKQNAILINTARGEIIDTSALLTHLQQGKFKGLAFDTLEDEETKGFTTNPYYQSLLEFDNVLLTPHIAYFTRAAVRDIAITALENARDIITEGKSENTVRQ